MNEPDSAAVRTVTIALLLLALLAVGAAKLRSHHAQQDRLQPPPAQMREMR